MNNDRPTAIAVAVGLSCIGVFGLIPQPIIVGALQDVLGFSSQQASLITAAEVIGGALASVCAAFWIRRVSWRAAALVAIAVVIGGNLLSSGLASYESLLLARFVVGFLGEGTAFAVAIGILSSTSEPDRNFAYAIAAQVAFGVIAFAALPSAVAQWELAGIFIPLAVVAGLIATMAGWIPTPAAETSDAADSKPAAVSPLPALVALSALLIWCLGLGGIYAFEERIGVAAGLSPAQVGTGLALAVAVGFLGALSASWVAGRFGRLAPVTLALLAQVGAIWMLQGQLSWIAFAIIASVFHFFWNFTGPYMMGAVAMNDQSGRVAVLIPAAQTGGFAIGTALAGSLMTGGNLLPANYVAIAGCLAALAIFVPVARRLARG